MLKKRLIVSLLLQNGQLVKSIGFRDYQIVGSPQIAIQFFNAWAADEIIFLDISTSREYTDLVRKDSVFPELSSLIEIVKNSAKTCFLPLTVGGGIRTIEQMHELFSSGADKIAINTQAVRTPKLITKAAERFGNQAVVVSIDARRKGTEKYEVFIDHGREATGFDPVDWAKKAEQRGAGEILLNSIDQDGALSGYDLPLIQGVSEAVTVPVIALGGVGKWGHLIDGVKAGASAVSAANIFHFTEQSTRQAKKYMANEGIDVRL